MNNIYNTCFKHIRSKKVVFIFYYFPDQFVYYLYLTGVCDKCWKLTHTKWDVLFVILTHLSLLCFYEKSLIHRCMWMK